MSLSLLDLAYMNYDNISRNPLLDEIHLRYYAYDLQQMAEKSIKAMLEYKGRKYPFTHDIRSLIIILDDDAVSELLEPIADTLTRYEAMTRYTADFYATSKSLSSMFTKVFEIYQLALKAKREMYGLDSNADKQTNEFLK